MAFFGLKLGLDLEMRAAHPHQKFQGVPPRGGPLKHSIHFIEMLPSMQLFYADAFSLITVIFKRDSNTLQKPPHLH